MSARILLYFAFIPLLLSACSLKYDEGVSVENSVPELVSQNASFSRIEKGKKVFTVKAENLEQYKAGNTTYAKNIEFKAFDKDEKLTSEGSCSLLSADSEKEEYILLDNIKIKNLQQNLDIFAESLKWNGKTEQLTGGKEEKVTLNKNDLTISGRGFSASAISNSFVFSENVEGSIIQNENAHNNNGTIQ